MGDKKCKARYKHPPPGFRDPKGAAYLQGYGLSYQLCDNSTDVVFNGNTHVILLNNTVSVTYVGDKSVEHYLKVEDYPPSLERRLLRAVTGKTALLNHFYSYMKQ
ncbi:hypothetical protein HPB50_027823 [Hyalomma asiaticum]|nr:hypothetical protein HPB50_027823 [Hyalomma asiaticum]